MHDEKPPALDVSISSTLGFDPTVLAFSADGKLLGTTTSNNSGGGGGAETGLGGRKETLEAQQRELEELQCAIKERQERLVRLTGEKREPQK